MRNIILCDNQEITKFALSKLLVSFDGIDVLLEVSNKKSLLLKLEDSPNAIVCLDYTLFDFVSVDELLIVQSRFEHVNWVIFSEHLSSDFIRNLLFSTTTFSILLKDCSLGEISMCFKDVISGKRFICNSVSNLLLENINVIQVSRIEKKLTSTEQEILKGMALGKTTKEIAKARFVSVHTVMTHRKNIFRKLDVNNVYEATKYAIRSGLIDMAEYYI